MIFIEKSINVFRIWIPSKYYKANMNKHNYQRRHDELSIMMKEIFGYFWYEYTRNGKCTLRETTDNRSVKIKILVQDLFEDLWNGTKLYNLKVMSRKSICIENDYYRLLAKGIFDELWNNKHQVFGK